MVVIDLFLSLASGYDRFINIDNHYIIAYFLVGGVGCFFLAPDNGCGPCRNPANTFPLGVNKKPFPLNLSRINKFSFHNLTFLYTLAADYLRTVQPAKTAFVTVKAALPEFVLQFNKTENMKNNALKKPIVSSPRVASTQSLMSSVLLTPR
jgi:hypothetical protein